MRLDVHKRCFSLGFADVTKSPNLMQKTPKIKLLKSSNFGIFSLCILKFLEIRYTTVYLIKTPFLSALTGMKENGIFQKV